MSGAPHRVVLASAGTGKTYRLSSRYIALLAGGVDPEQVLGSTFTRKAAAEILDRILGRLVEAAQDERRLAELNGPPEALELTREQCAALLARLGRRIDRLQVRTLDSLFVQLAQVLGLELGLPPGWHLADDAEEDALLREAMARILDGTGRDEMLGLLADLHEGQSRRSVHEVLLELLRADLGLFQESDPEGWGQLALPPALEPEERAARLAELEAFELPRNARGDPNGHWTNARDDLLNTLRAEDWTALIEGGGLVPAVLKGKKQYQRHEIEDELRELLMLWARHAAHFVLERQQRSLVAHRQLLRRFQRVREELQRERGAYRFEDLPRSLADQPGMAEPLFDRLGARFEHMLLDEFQDTSVLQWRVLRPWAERTLGDASGARSFFCVGDIKQSIYAWRAGEPRLLADLAQEYPVLEREQLGDSWRSAAVVLDLVGRVFDGLEQREVVRSDEPLLEAARAFGEGYHPLRARLDQPGWASVWEVDTGEGGAAEVRNALLEAVAEHVAGLAARAPVCSIGVLYRTRRSIPAMIHRLQHVHGLRASGEAGNPLLDSEAVQLALSLLHAADHPGDTAAWFHVVRAPLAGAWFALLGVPLVQGAGVAWARGEGGPAAASRALRRALLEQGYGPFLARLQQAVEQVEVFDAWDRTRFGQLVDLAHAWEPRGTLRPSDFVAFVRREKVEDPGGARVKVMTVHAAKGREFDAVVLPELQGTMMRPSDRLIHERPNPRGKITRVFRWPKEPLRTLCPELKELWQRHRVRGMQEALCLLYVALTRAARRVDLFVPSHVARFRGIRFEQLLPDALRRPSGDGDGSARGEGPQASPRVVELWRHPDSLEGWHAGTKVGATPEPEDHAQPDGALVLPPSPRPRLLARRAPSTHEQVRVGALLRSEGARARSRGLVLHAWFEQVEWLDPSGAAAGADDASLRRVASRLAAERGLRLAEADLDAWLQDFRAMLGRPALRSLLDRDEQRRLAAGQGLPAEAEPELWRERPFRLVLPDAGGEPALMSGVFDRVVLWRVDGRPLRAEVIDFKTDRVDGPAALDERVERYRPQLEQYGRALAQLSGLPAAQVGLRLAFVSLGDVRSL